MNIKSELLKLLTEYEKDFDTANRRIAEVEYQYRRNMARKEMSFPNFIKWLATGKL